MIQDTSRSSKRNLSVLPSSLQYIIRSLQEQRELRPSHLTRILHEAEVKAEDLSPWADLEHTASDSYGRQLVYKGGHFEIMVMSWQPGDFSTIHDHGHTQWGAVQIFGPAEHATFRLENGKLTTLARWDVSPGDIVGVSHTLIHQMGNPTEQTPFLSLHIYGNVEEIKNVTGDARIFDPGKQVIYRVDGGVFFGLPEEKIKKTEPGPAADFPTSLRHMTELIRRLRKMESADIDLQGYDLEAFINDTFSFKQRGSLIRYLKDITDENDHQVNSIAWRILNRELKEVAKLQLELGGLAKSKDHFHKYAQLYDGLIGLPCLKGFMAEYLKFFVERYQSDLRGKSLISLGCGTGLVERFLIEELEMDPERVYGIDISEAMIAVARERIHADVEDILQLDPDVQQWDLAYSGLNVFQYIDHTRLEEAIRKTAAIVKTGGYFVGDFITPDHIRWYPNVVYSEDGHMISLRTPQLIEENGSNFQESEIVNIEFAEDQMEVTYAGRHRRFLPPVNRIRNYFERAFGGQVDLYDAHSLELIPQWADSCKSTRYIVIAQKNNYQT
ncbi:MAG: methyltransferase domain-containing protein [Saprospiraceae bacterium]|nr:methyltransferase domain-containing protein [Lewinella sp.]